jgi:hypothetical protein
MRKFLAGFVSVAMWFVIGCGGATVQTNPNAKFPLPVSDTAPAFLFPINMSHLGAPGDPMAMGLSVSGGVIAKFGKQVISGQQLFDLVGNLSFELAEQMRSQVQSKQFKMTGGAEPVANGLSKIMQGILDKLASLNLLPAGYKFQYIICVHSHGSSTMAGKMLSVESWGGIYDVASKEILSYIESKDSYANDSKVVLAQIPLAYNAIIEKLLAGTADKKN